jgi:putative addiction module antidote
MTALKITAVGNSGAVLLPKELLAKMRIKKGDLPHVIETLNGIELSPYDPDFENQIEISDDIMHEDLEILRKLAKGAI